MTPTISKNQFKYLTSLKEKKYRKKHREFLIEGLKLCQEALNSTFPVRAVGYCPAIFDLPANSQFIDQVRGRDLELFEITTGMLHKLSDTVTSQGVVGVVAQREYGLADIVAGQTSLLVAVEHLADPGNLGTIIRTADWFGADAVILDDASADWLSPKVIRASMGSIFHLPILEKQNLPEIIDYFQRLGYLTVGTTLDGDALAPRDLVTERQLIILGNEARGLSPEIKQKVSRQIKISGLGQAESLNVAIAGGILMHFFRQRRIEIK